MNDFIKYILSEVKHNRLDKTGAMELIKNYKESGVKPFEFENTAKNNNRPAIESNKAINNQEALGYIPRWEIKEQDSFTGYRRIPENSVVIIANKENQKFERAIISSFYTKYGLSELDIIKIYTDEVDSTGSFGVNEHSRLKTALDGKKIDYVFFVSGQQGCKGDSESLIREEAQLLRVFKQIRKSLIRESLVDFIIITQDLYPISNTKHSSVCGAGLTGMAYSIAQGDHRFFVKNIDCSSEELDDKDKSQGLIHKIISLPPWDRGEPIRIESGKVYHRVFDTIGDYSIPLFSGLRENGTYILIGGRGTVGKVITRQLIRKYNANVIWVGRRSSQDIQSDIAPFKKEEKVPDYIQADITDPASIDTVISKVLDKYGVIHGGVFCALDMHKESALHELDEDDFNRTFEIKSKGTSIFYNAFSGLPLDFLCIFSSAQAFPFVSAKDSAGYAAGITYSDALTRSLATQSKIPSGTINWGYWNASKESLGFGDDFDAKFKFISDDEGFRIFESYISLLKQNSVSQILYLPASDNVQKLMNLSSETVDFLNKKPLEGFQANISEKFYEKKRLLDSFIKNETWVAFNKHLVNLLFTQIMELEVFDSDGKAKNFKSSRVDAGIPDTFERWWNECCLGILCEAGFIEWDGDDVKLTNTYEKDDHQNFWRSWESDKGKFLNDSELKTSVSLVEECLKSLPQILRGNIKPTDVLFPGSSMGKVENMYKRNQLSDYFNSIVAELSYTYIKDLLAKDSDRKFKMIEIGAGTGGTTAMVLPSLSSLRDNIDSYLYTDLSRAFLLHGEEQFGENYPFLDYKILNIEQPIASQGVALGSYDIVVATNVLHATKDIRNTLQNAKASLKPGGLLLLNERIDKSIVGTLTFGLLDGWWFFEDDELRIQGSPLLESDTWKRVLAEEGFVSIACPADEITGFGQQVFQAVSNGVIRQKEDPTNNVNQNATSQSATEKTILSASEETEDINTFKYSEEEMKDSVQGIVLKALSTSLKIEKNSVEIDIPFSDYGIDSILGVRFIGQIGEALGIKVNTAVIYDYSTVENLTNYLIKTYKSQIIGKFSYSKDNRKTEKSPKISAEKSPHTNKVSALQVRSNQEPSIEKQGNLSDDQNKENINNTVGNLKSESEIAVIGISGQFPGAKTPKEFWDNIVSGVDGVQQLPDDYIQSNDDGYQWGGVLEQRDYFDCSFFNISPREARNMNPHQRLILQESWKSLEDAGYSPKMFRGFPVALFIGAEPTGRIYDSFTGTSEAIIASRLSYFLNLRGPAMVVNTGCSSSGVAIHLACESIRTGESNVALAGGVFATMSQEGLNRLADIEMLSPSGSCSTFDASGNGTVLSEGVGVVVLKNLDDAVKDKDNIYGVIAASGMNQDGASNGITAPSGIAQEELITKTYKRFGLSPEDISYIEAHGTGTKLGDPVEANALVRVFSEFSDKKNYCAIGSAKSHIGHTAASAGVIGLIKILLSLKHQEIPGLLNFEKLNPLIELDNTAFYINKKNKPWIPPYGSPRIAALNSFGHSGTNVHIVVKEYKPPCNDSRIINEIEFPEYAIIPISAKSKESLNYAIENLYSFVKNIDINVSEEQTLHNVAYTMQVAREHMSHRVVLVAQTLKTLIKQLKKLDKNKLSVKNVWQRDVSDISDGSEKFITNSNLRRLTEEHVAAKKLGKIAKLWSQGHPIDWNLVYPPAGVNRIRLPVYEFQKNAILDQYKQASEVLLTSTKVNKNSDKLNNTSDVTHGKSNSVDSQNMMLMPVWRVFNNNEVSELFEATSIVVIGSDKSLTNILKTSHLSNEMTDQLISLHPKELEKKQYVKAKLQGLRSNPHVIWVSDAEPLVSALQPKGSDILKLFALVKTLLKLGYGTKDIAFTVLTHQAHIVHVSDKINPFESSIHGFIGSMAKEFPHWKVRLVDLGLKEMCDRNLSHWESILSAPYLKDGNSLAYRRGEWFKLSLASIKNQKNSTTPYKKNGVYIIIGGAGGLGVTWSKVLAEKFQARTIWIGRRKINEEINENIKLISQYGPKPIYIQADAGDEESLREAVEFVKDTYGRINAVVHSAIVLSDQSLDNMDKEQFKNGLSAKVDITISMANVLHNEKLDFVLFFSGLMSYIRAPGQSNYAAGCSFKDAMAKSMAVKCNFPVKVINWGYWGDTGVVASESYRNRMTKVGIGSISLEQGMAATNWLLEHDIDQIGFINLLRPDAIQNWMTNENIILHRDHEFDITEKIRLNDDRYQERIGKVNTGLKNLLPGLDRILTEITWGYIQKYLSLSPKNNTVTIDKKVLDKSNFIQHWIFASVDILASFGFLRKTEDENVFAGPSVNLDITWTEWNNAKPRWKSNASLGGQIELIEVCLTCLPEILSGEKPATDVLFPNGSMALVEAVHKDSEMGHILTDIIADAVIAIIKSHKRNGKQNHQKFNKVRILEIGAGVGGTTGQLISRLSDYQESIDEYNFTDISKAFLVQAKANYASRAKYLATQLFDVENAPETQGIKLGHYDIVIATNVLHATKNIRETLKNAKAVLKQNGILLINEVSTLSLVSHVTFGLLDGWWRFDDPATRIPYSPGAYPEQWHNLLFQQGFKDVSFPALSAHDLGQQIILARSDGFARSGQDVGNGDDNAASITGSSVDLKPSNNIKVKISGKSSSKKDIKLFVYKSVVESLAECLEIPQSDINATIPFSEFGLDSILGNSFLKLLNEKLSIDLSSSILFEFVNAGQLTKHIAEVNDITIESVNDFDNSVSNNIGADTKINRDILMSDKSTTLNKNSNIKSTDIAVIGMSGQFPGAKNIDVFWDNLINGVDCVSVLPSSYLDSESDFNPKKQKGKSYCKWGGILEDRDCFDPLFFNISPREAESMNPHQRLILQESWRSLEDAGYNPKSLSGLQVGLFVGAEPTQYHHESFTGGSEAIVASRLSYFLNLNGPAMVVNTGCSSSGAAMHVACESLRSGETSLAITGGVYAVMNRKMLVTLAQTEMLSYGGSCKAFDASADGTAFAEGVGVLVFKRLQEAIDANDNIYGVIEASGANQDGMSNGITAPNGASQETMIEQIYRRYDIDPEGISYIEAHGTGTRLGDPVEANALVRAFKSFTDKQGYCALGSAKAHIGHSAASSASIGMIKILMSMKHRKIPGLLHFKKLNPLIKLDGSAFYINPNSVDWESKDRQPLRAALNSFGHSGTNVHFVVRQFQETSTPPELDNSSVNPEVIVLSAKNEEQLVTVAHNLLNFIERQNDTQSISLSDLAYSLQVTREGMEERLAFTTSNIQQVVITLRNFVNAAKLDQNVWRHHVDEAENDFDKVDDDTPSIIDRLWSLKDCDEIARLWAYGSMIDWDTLHAAKKPRRLRIPTYPFARERYWKNNSENTIDVKEIVNKDYLHPLVHKNTSDFTQQSYSSLFSGSEFFLADHQVKDKKVLPAVAYLEMARVAVKHALGNSYDENKLFQMERITWAKPFEITTPNTPINIKLSLYKEKEIKFEIFSYLDGNIEEINSSQTITHCQGFATLGDAKVVKKADINYLLSTFDKVRFDKEYYYSEFKRVGINYGESHQGLCAIYTRPGEILAKINLAEVAVSSLVDYRIHPAVLDSALQAATGFSLLADDNDKNNKQTYLPFGLEKIEVLNGCRPSMWAILKIDQNDIMSKYDLELMDEDGNICLRLQGFSSRAFGIETGNLSTDNKKQLRYSSVFTRDDNFIKDHGSMLPGAVFLAMAINHASEKSVDSIRGLKNVVWRSPLVLRESSLESFFEVYKKNEEYHYTVNSQYNGVSTTHFQGQYLKDSRTTTGPRYDVEIIKNRCAKVLSRHECNTLLKGSHGPSLFCIEKVFHNGGELLAEIKTPYSDSRYILQPSMLNGAVLSSVILFLLESNGTNLPMPFALDEMVMFGKITDLAYVYVRGSNQKSHGLSKKYDIDIVDSQGETAICFKGLTLVVNKPKEGLKNSDLIFATTKWQTENIEDASTSYESEPPAFIVDSRKSYLIDALYESWPQAKILKLEKFTNTDSRSLIENFQRIFQFIQGFCHTRPKGNQRVFVLASEFYDNLLTNMSMGLFKTAKLEHDWIDGKIIYYPENLENKTNTLVEKLKSEIQSNSAVFEVSYSENWLRTIKQLEEVNPPSGQATYLNLIPGDVVWITGGLGGIGLIFAKFLSQSQGVTVVLNGRSSLDDEKRQLLDDCQVNGNKVYYYRSDVCDPKQVTDFIEKVSSKHGEITGIIHNAGILKDSFIREKNIDDIKTVMAPKITGIDIIDEKTCDLDLKFLILFSSLSSITGNTGQADYSAANAFLDAFSAKRNRLVHQGLRKGKTLSVNWPFWKDGGMHMSQMSLDIMAREFGMNSLDSGLGIRALNEVIQCNMSHVVVTQGDGEKIKRILFSSNDTSIPSAMAQKTEQIIPFVTKNKEQGDTVNNNEYSSSGKSVTGLDFSKNIVVSAVAELQKIAQGKIKIKAEFSTYGFDSISFTELANLLNTKYELTLMPTVFFEYPTLLSFCQYLADKIPEKYLQTNDNIENVAVGEEKYQEIEVNSNQPLTKRDAFLSSTKWASKTNTVSETERGSEETASANDIQGDSLSAEDDKEIKTIAIVGMNGRFPGSKNLDEYWSNLENNEDLISQIPADRWNWKDYYGNPLEEPGKTQVNMAGFLSEVDKFDPLFFGISPLEAQTMDPQLRLLLETVWCTVEDAGYKPSALSGSRIGVFIGASTTDYKELLQDISLKTDTPLSSVNYHYAIANRISYFLNLRGPSEAIDTACSSSLVALNRAVESIRQGTCDSALVGGVNVIVHPNLFLASSQGGMLSIDGRCKTFDRSANGYARGEGVGAIYIKPLNQAQRNRDRIYAVINAIGENHGGRATSPTAPNPIAQQELIVNCYERASIHPNSVTYIEAHGTGTELGDPIEVNGLKGAFNEMYEKDGIDKPSTPFCALGSVKANIGHLEAAAGISAILKILLMLKNGKIPGNPHLRNPNPYLSIENSPFYLIKDTKEWHTPKGTDGLPIPRKAGLSSFGIGGSNAHAVIEQYIDPDGELNDDCLKNSDPALIIVSAKTETSLNRAVENLLAYALSSLELEQTTSAHLASVAYTLQVGREDFEWRFACTVDSFQELIEKARALLSKRKSVGNTFTGQVIENSESVIALLEDKNIVYTIDGHIKENRYDRILELWTRGLTIDWLKMYKSTLPPKISLPNYPFLRERHWIENSVNESASSGSDNRKEDVATEKITYETTANVGSEHFQKLHPLVHTNTSNLEEQKYTTSFNGNEFFFSDHVLAGNKLFPGAAYLEMVRAAIQLACTVEKGTIELKHVVWISPFVFSGEKPNQKLHIAFDVNEARDISFSIYSNLNDGTGDKIATSHCQGSVAIIESQVKEHLDLKMLSRRIDEQVIDGQKCYQVFKETGLVYGPAHKGIESLSLNSNEALVKLALPMSMQMALSEYVLHPGMLDSALQSILGFLLETQSVANGINTRAPYLPFALDSMEIYKPCKGTMWAWTRKTEVSGKHAKQLIKVDIDLCDEAGEICSRIKGFTSKRAISPIKTESAIDAILYQPVWKPSEYLQNESEVYSTHIVMLYGMDMLDFRGNGISFIHLPSEDKNLGSRYSECALNVFRTVKHVLETKKNSKTLIQIFISSSSDTQLLSGLVSILKTANWENPKFKGQLIEIDQNLNEEELIHKAKENIQFVNENHIRYQDGIRQHMDWEQLTIENSGKSELADSVVWKNNGVYLITGGAGGFGLSLIESIVRSIPSVNIILSGRSDLSVEQIAKVESVKSRGNIVIEYVQVDVTDRVSVNHLIENINANYDGLNGVIHAAGVIHDNYIIKKTEAEFSSVLSPKVMGTVNLDQATRAVPLDFIVFCSSGTGAMGNAGQVDYAAANAFMDCYAEYRNTLVAVKQRRGHTISINWPLLKNGGMRLSEFEQEEMRANTGMVALETSKCIDIIARGLNLEISRLMVINGDIDLIQKNFSNGHVIESNSDAGDKNSYGVENLEKPVHEASETTNEGKIGDKTKAYLKDKLSKLLKVPPYKIRDHENFEQYGLDSVLSTRITVQLEKVFGSLSKTIFFEYPSLQELSEYFQQNHSQKLAEILHISPRKNDISAGEISVEKAYSKPSPLLKNTSHRRLIRKNAAQVDNSTPTPIFPTTDVNSISSEDEKNRGGVEEIAIIGLAGRFPMASDIEVFWKNLSEGKDCITEVPANRWDWRHFYAGEDASEGKHRSKWGGFIEEVDEFDPLFFNISPLEAQVIDPKERLFMETVWTLMEGAGYTRDAIKENYQGSVGVYVGAMYQQYHAFDSDEKSESIVSVSSQSSVANRVSYFFDFQGPSVAIDTMCSSSLTAIRMARDSLFDGECRLAIAGGVNLSIHPKKYSGLSLTKMIASHPQSRSFAQGDGYLPCEAVGAVLLKKLSEAIDDGNEILAIVKSIATNHGGYSNGYSVPNSKAQIRLIEDNFKKSNVDPRTIGYVESAANGSAIGDAIEVSALNAVFSKFSDDKNFCAIGAVKSNIGHAEAASGISQLAKVILQFKHKKLVPTIKAKPLNTNINFDNSPFKLQEKMEDWPRPVIEIKGKATTFPRRATVSAFGAAGSNAHVILEEYPHVTLPHNGGIEEVSPQVAVVTLSAKSHHALRKVASNLAEYIKERPIISFANILYTLQVGREAMDYKLSFVAQTLEELQQGLHQYLNSGSDEDTENTFINLHIGNEGEVSNKIESLLAGQASELIVNSFIEENNLEQLAAYWVMGGKIRWQDFYQENRAKLIGLPTYPFEKQKCWIPLIEKNSANSNSDPNDYTNTGNYDGGKVKGIPKPWAAKRATVDLKEWLCIEIGRQLGITNEKISTTKNLITMGFNSIIAVSLKSVIEKYTGETIPLEIINAYDSIEKIEKNIRKVISASAISALLDDTTSSKKDKLLPEIIIDEDNRYEPFPLSDIQESFLINRQLSQSEKGVGCHIYLEMEDVGINIYQLNNAWKKLVDHHDMLRIVMLAKGKQQILEKSCAYEFKISDLRRKPESFIKDHFLNVRKRMSHSVYTFGEWPLFEIRVSILPENKYVIHFSIDELVVDASSLNLLLQQWMSLYKNPETKLSKLDVSFRDFVIATKSFEKSARYRESLEYWMERLDNMPNGPQFLAKKVDEHHCTRLEGRLEKSHWHKIKEKASALRLSPTSIILSAFSLVLLDENDNQGLSLILTYFNRLNLHPQLNEVLAPFISTNLFTINPKNDQTNTQWLGDTQQQLWQDLDNSSVSGIKVLRELKKRKLIKNDVALPVVFTSLLGGNDSDMGESFLNKTSYSVTQTPDVFLDHQVREHEGCLVFTWDVVKKSFNQNNAEELFSAYCQLLVDLAENPFDNASIVRSQNEKVKDFELLENSRNRSKPFPLTDQQQAYAFGRSKYGANVASQVYMYFGVENIDVEKFEAAWNEVINSNDMLKTIIFENGNQRLYSDAPAYEVAVSNFRKLDGNERQSELVNIQESMLSRVCPLGSWPYFDVRITHLNDKTSIAHFSIDMIIADGPSINVITQQLISRYTGSLPRVAEVSFRDYVMSLKKYKKTDSYRESSDYWSEKFRTIKGAPKLPMFENPAPTKTLRLEGKISRWNDLKRMSRSLNTLPGMILLTVYAEVLLAWANYQPFAIVIPSFKRLPVHSDIDAVIGDFTAMSWLPVRKNNLSFKERVKLSHKTVSDDISHSLVSGLNILRRSSMKNKESSELNFPIVFTDFEPTKKIDLPDGFTFGDSLSQTSQVHIDNISMEMGNELKIHWDIANTVFPENMINEMFAGYKRLLDYLLEDFTRWNETNFDSLLKAEPQKYKNLVSKVSTGGEEKIA